MNVLEIENLYKKFGTHEVIKNLNMAVPKHSVFGFLGQNGSGKTTTMKMILGLLKMDKGKITVCQENVNYGVSKTNKYIGYLPDVPEFYNYMNVMEYLRLCGQIAGLTDKDIRIRGSSLLEMVGLKVNKKRIGGYSRGMKQRLGIAQALLHEPKLLICDEPTSALDPAGRFEILNTLELVSDKTTVLFSTHILSDVERICDQAAVLNQGKIVLSGSLKSIKEKHKADTLYIEFISTEDCKKFKTEEKIRKILNSNTADLNNENNIYIKTDNITEVLKEILKVLAGKSILPKKMEMLEPTLESLFMEVIHNESV